MIVCDANLIVYSYNTGAAHHAKARAWVEEAFSGAIGRLRVRGEVAQFVDTR